LLNCLKGIKMTNPKEQASFRVDQQCRHPFVAPAWGSAALCVAEQMRQRARESKADSHDFAAPSQEEFLAALRDKELDWQRVTLSKWMNMLAYYRRAAEFWAFLSERL
jgi:hypothetical protein